MTIERAPSTNGRERVEHAIESAREALQTSRKGRVRPRKLAVPVLLALGVILFFRYLEQSTGDR
jgi:hypothetical protein